MPKGNRTKGRKPNSGQKKGNHLKGIEPVTLEKFCRQYVLHGSKMNAAIEAGYAKSGAGSIGSKLLKRPEVIQMIAHLRKVQADRFEINIDKLTQEYASVAFADMKDFVEEGNEIVDVSKLDRRLSKAVQSIKRTVTEFEGGSKTTIEIKLHSKLAGLEALGRHVGMFEVDNKQKTVKFKIGFDSK
jgi:phage terminase small subunit